MRVVAALCVLAALAVYGCSSSTTTPTVQVTFVTDTFNGTVPAAVNGVAQSDAKNFTMASGGTITVVLTSAVETFPGGSLNASVVMGAAIGTFAGGVCTPASSTFLGPASSTPILTVSAQAGGS